MNDVFALAFANAIAVADDGFALALAQAAAVANCATPCCVL